jgi:hypothetical protein
MATDAVVERARAWLVKRYIRVDRVSSGNTIDPMLDALLADFAAEETKALREALKEILSKVKHAEEQPMYGSEMDYGLSEARKIAEAALADELEAERKREG